MLRSDFKVMGGYGEILIDEVHADVAPSAVLAAHNEISRLENKFSFFKAESLVGLINSNAFHRPVSLDKESEEIFRFVQSLNNATSGKFDPTVGSVARSWDFKSQKIPKKKEIDAALAGVGWHHVEIKNGWIRFHNPLTKIDLGGIIKEYAVDRACQIMESFGICSGVVSLGGDLKVIGEENQRTWRVGIAHPRKSDEFVGTLHVTKGAVVTSGDYKRYFVRNGIHYHHILDPSTGYPLKLEYSGVTVHSNDAMDASRLATTFLLGGFGGVENSAGCVLCDMSGKPVSWQGDEFCSVSIREGYKNWPVQPAEKPNVLHRKFSLS